MTLPFDQKYDRDVQSGSFAQCDSPRSVILEKMAAGAPLDELLTHIICVVENETPGARCAILLTDTAGTTLRLGSAPSLSELYGKTMDNIKITLESGSCPATAAFLHKRVIIQDTANSPAPSVPETCGQAGFRSCWAEPVISGTGELLGVFVSHQPLPHTPGHNEIEIVQSMVRLASIAIERMKAAEKQRCLEEQLRHMQKIEAIGQLTGGIAHDFSNMLTPIFVYAEMIKRTLADNDPNLKKMEYLIASANKAKEITQKLLSFSRKQTLNMAVLDLNEVMDSFQELLRRTIRENVIITFYPSPVPVKVFADQGQLEQVLLNLAVNAQDAIAGKGEIFIRTGHVLLDDEYARQHPGMKSGAHVMLAFTDTGCGIDDEVMQHLFEPFFTTKAIGQGTGLGLATVYGIIKQHEGYIKVASKPGNGTTFTVYLPEHSGNDKTAAIQQTGESQLPQSMKETTVLFVDDNNMLLEMAVELLESAGFTVLAADSPLKAQQFAASPDIAIDLLVSDVIMPGMSGPELYEQLVLKYPDLPVLFISGYTNDVQLPMDTLNETVNFLPKPFTLEQLLSHIQQLVK